MIQFTYFLRDWHAAAETERERLLISS